jgi:hypothetical protein
LAELITGLRPASMAGTCTLSKEQSSPEMRWHSLTSTVVFGDPGELAWSGADADPGGYRQPEGRGIDVEPVAADDTGGLAVQVT